MPCGGIWPTKIPTRIENKNSIRCFYCNKGGLVNKITHFCEEWDCFLHAECIDAFLLTEEGKVVTSHGHEVIR